MQKHDHLVNQPLWQLQKSSYSIILLFISCITVAHAAKCLKNEYEDTQTNTCQPCDAVCATCIVAGSAGCTQCSTALYEGKCLLACPISTSLTSNTEFRCEECEIKFCKTCASLEKCSECSTGFELNPSQTVCIPSEDPPSNTPYTLIREDTAESEAVFVEQCPVNMEPNAYAFCERISVCESSQNSNSKEFTCFQDIKNITNFVETSQVLAFYKQHELIFIDKTSSQFMHYFHTTYTILKIIPFNSDLLFVSESAINVFDSLTLTFKSQIALPTPSAIFSSLTQLFIKNNVPFIVTISSQNTQVIVFPLAKPSSYLEIVAGAVETIMFDPESSKLVIQTFRSLVFVVITPTNSTNLEMSNYNLLSTGQTEDEYHVASLMTYKYEKYVCVSSNFFLGVYSLSTESLSAERYFQKSGLTAIGNAFLPINQYTLDWSDEIMLIQSMEWIFRFGNSNEYAQHTYIVFFPIVATETSNFIFIYGIDPMPRVTVFTRQLIVFQTIPLFDSEVISIQIFTVNSQKRILLLSKSVTAVYFEQLETEIIDLMSPCTISKQVTLVPDSNTIILQKQSDPMRGWNIYVSIQSSGRISVSKTSLRTDTILVRITDIEIDIINKYLLHLSGISMQTTIVTMTCMEYVFFHDPVEKAAVELEFDYCLMKVNSMRAFLDLRGFTLSPLSFQGSLEDDSFGYFWRMSSSAGLENFMRPYGFAKFYCYTTTYAAYLIVETNGPTLYTFDINAQIVRSVLLSFADEILQLAATDTDVILITREKIKRYSLDDLTEPKTETMNIMTFLLETGTIYTPQLFILKSQGVIFVIFSGDLNSLQKAKVYVVLNYDTLFPVQILEPAYYFFGNWESDKQMVANEELIDAPSQADGSSSSSSSEKEIVAKSWYSTAKQIWVVRYGVENGLLVIKERREISNLPVFEIIQKYEYGMFEIYKSFIFAELENRNRQLYLGSLTKTFSPAQTTNLQILNDEMFIGNSIIPAYIKRTTLQPKRFAGSTIPTLSLADDSTLMYIVQNRATLIETLNLYMYTQAKLLQTYVYTSRCPTIPPQYLQRIQLVVLCDDSEVKIFKAADLSTPLNSISIASATCVSPNTTCGITYFTKFNALAINSIGFFDLNSLSLISIPGLHANSKSMEILDTSNYAYYFDSNAASVNRITRIASEITETKSYVQSGLFKITKIQFLPENIVIGFEKDSETKPKRVSVFDLTMELLLSVSEETDGILFKNEYFSVCMDGSALILQQDAYTIAYSLPLKLNSSPIQSILNGKNSFLSCLGGGYYLMMNTATANVISFIVFDADSSFTPLNTLEINTTIHPIYTSVFSANAATTPNVMYCKNKGLLIISDIVFSLMDSFRYFTYMTYLTYDVKNSILVAVAENQMVPESTEIRFFDFEELFPFFTNKFSIVKRAKLHGYLDDSFSSIAYYNYEQNAIERISFASTAPSTSSSSSSTYLSLSAMKVRFEPSYLSQRTCKIGPDLFITIFQSATILFSTTTIIEEKPQIPVNEIRFSGNCTNIFAFSSSKVYSIQVKQKTTTTSTTYLTTMTEVPLGYVLGFAKLLTSAVNGEYFATIDMMCQCALSRSNSGTTTFIRKAQFMFACMPAATISMQLVSFSLNTIQVMYVFAWVNSQVVIVSEDTTVAVYTLSDFTFSSTIKQIYVDPVNNAAIIVDAYYIYMFAISFFPVSSNSNNIALIFKSKIEQYYRTGYRIARLSADFLVLFRSSTVHVLKITPTILYEAHRIESELFVAPSFAKLESIIDANGIDSKAFLIITDAKRTYLFEIFLLTNESNLIESVSNPLSTFLGSRIVTSNFYQSVEFLSLTPSSSRRSMIQIADDSRNFWPTTSTSTCVLEANIRESPNQQLMQLSDVFLKNQERIRMLSLAATQSKQEIMIPTTFGINPSSRIDLMYNFANFDPIFVNEGGDQTILSNSFIRKLTFSNGTLAISGSNKSLKFADFDEVILSDLYVSGSISFENVKQITFKNLTIADSAVVISIVNADQLIVRTFEIAASIVDVSVVISNVKTVIIEKVIVSNSKSNGAVSTSLDSIESSEFNRLKDSCFFVIKQSESASLSNFSISKVNFLQKLVYTENVKLFRLSSLTISEVNSNVASKVRQLLELPHRNLADSAAITTYPALISVIFSTESVELENIKINNFESGALAKIQNYMNQNGVNSRIYARLSAVSMKNVEISLISDLTNTKPVLFDITGGIVVLDSFVVNRISAFSQAIHVENMKSLTMNSIEFIQMNDFTNLVRVQGGDALVIKGFHVEASYSIEIYLLIEDVHFSLQDLTILAGEAAGATAQNKFHVKSSAISLIFSSTAIAAAASNNFNNEIINCSIKNLLNQQGDGTAMSLVSIKGVVHFTNVLISENVSKGNAGAIYLKYSTILFSNVRLIHNKAFLSGGAMYSLESSIDVLDSEGTTAPKTSISWNSALIGGGIRYFNKVGATPILVLKYQMYFQSNSAELYGNSIAMYPVTFKLLGSTTNTSDPSEFKDIKSSVSVKSKVLFEWFDEENRAVRLSLPSTQSGGGQQLVTDYSSISDELDQFLTLSVNSSDILFNGDSTIIKLTGTVNVDNTQSALTEVSMLAYPNSSSKLNASFPLSLIVKDFLWQTVNEQQSIPFEFRNCEIGEVQNVINSQKIECKTCEDQTYSLEDPTSSPDIQCKQCPDLARKCYSNVIQLYDNYWIDTTSSDIEYCLYAPDNCMFDQTTNKNCIEGSTGPRCESCDYYQKDSETVGPYGRVNRYQCVDCTANSTKATSILKIIFGICFFGMYLGYLSIKMCNTAQNIVKGMYLKRAGMITFGSSLTTSLFNTIMKLSFSYFQLLQLLAQFKFQAPSWINFVINIIGNPIETTKFSMDCVFIQKILPSDLDLLYIRFIYNMIIVLLYIIIAVTFTCAYSLITLKHKTKDVKIFFLLKYLKTTMYYLYYLLYPSVVLMLVEIMSCERIGSKSYVQIDVQFECYTTQHSIFAYVVALPLLLITMIGIPLFIFRNRLYRNREKLEKVGMFLSYSFFYSEYKLKHYYWEILKISMKSLIYLSVNFFKGSPILIGCFVCLIIALYIRIAYIAKPYKRQFLNNIDFMSCITIFISFQLGIINLKTRNSIVEVLCAIFVIIINLGFILFFAGSIIAQRIQYHEKSSYFFIIRFLKKKFPLFVKRYTIYSSSSYQSHKGWAKLRALVRNTKNSQIFSPVGRFEKILTDRRSRINLYTSQYKTEDQILETEKDLEIFTSPVIKSQVQEVIVEQIEFDQKSVESGQKIIIFPESEDSVHFLPSSPTVFTPTVFQTQQDTFENEIMPFQSQSVRQPSTINEDIFSNDNLIPEEFINPKNSERLQFKNVQVKDNQPTAKIE